MSKAILVIDMPKNCGECSICASWQESAYSAREYWCPVMDNKDVEPNKKPVWCPLKYVPKKQPHYSIDETFMRGAKTGYNACIDDILKGSEENG
jgi:hypothetical protein